MRISDNEVKKILGGEYAIVEEIVQQGEQIQREEDQALVQNLTEAIVAMPDREEMIEALRAKIEAGEYHPTGDEIADTMIRRAIADRIK
jgi:anti-sigma28 factor (negative regulator of flagellin synthesis)